MAQKLIKVSQIAQIPYSSLSGLPTLFDGTWASLTGKPTLFDGTYASLTGKPTLFSGAYTDLTGKPSFAAVALSGAYADLTGTPTLGTLAGVSPTGTGSATTYLRGDNSWATIPAGFTNPMTTAGDIIYGGVSGAATRLAAGTTSQLLIGGATPSWGAVNLASMVTGVTPVANGGTGSSTLALPYTATIVGSLNTWSFSSTGSAISNTGTNDTYFKSSGNAYWQPQGGTTNVFGVVSTGVVITGNITPDATGTRSLGSSSLLWANLYVGNAAIATTFFNGASDNNWRMGKALGGTTRSLSASIELLTGSGVNDGFVVGVNGGNSMLELAGSTGYAYFRNNVGIGTAATSNRLTIAGNIVPEAAGTRDIGTTTLPFNNAYVQYVQLNSGATNYGIISAGNNAIAYNTQNSNGRHIFYNSGTEKLRINESGNIGANGLQLPTQAFETSSTSLGYANTMGSMSTFTATPSTTGGTIAAGTNYLKMVAVDPSGGITAAGSEVTVTTTGTTSSIALSWTAVTGAVSYRVYQGTTAGGENQWFSVTGTSFTIQNFTGWTAGTPPTSNSAYLTRIGPASGHVTGTLIVSNGVLALNTTYGMAFQGIGNTSWRVGRNIASSSGGSLTTNALQVVVTNNTNEGFQILGNSNVTMFEVGSNDGTNIFGKMYGAFSATKAITTGAWPTAQMQVANRDYADSDVVKYTNGFGITRRPNIRQVVTPVSGEGWLYYFTAKTNDTIIKVQVNTSGAVGSGLTLARVGIYTVDASDNLTLVASTASSTTGYGTAYNSVVTGLSANYTFVPGTRYAVMVLFVGTTPPSMVCASGSDDYGQNAFIPRLCGKVTSLSDLPSTQANTGVSATGVGINVVMLQS